MAKDTGANHRIGSVTGRSQIQNPQNGNGTKRGPDGKFMDQKQDGDPFKGVAKEVAKDVAKEVDGRKK